MLSTNSCNAPSSMMCRGCSGSGSILSILMKNAPAKYRRASHSGGMAPPSSNCSNGCFLENARSAALLAVSVFFKAPFDFVEESAGDACGAASGTVEGNGDAIGDGTFKGCQIRHDSVKGQDTIMLAKAGQVHLVVQPALLVPGGQIPQQRQPGVVFPLHVLHRPGYLLNPLRTPVGGLHRDHDGIACRQRCEAYERQSRRTIEHDVIVLRRKSLHRIDEAPLQS